jgi:hypothetical protein
MEDALICDGGATCTLTKTLENCTQCKPMVVEIQTAQGATIMSTTLLCLKIRAGVSSSVGHAGRPPILSAARAAGCSSGALQACGRVSVDHGS